MFCNPAQKCATVWKLPFSFCRWEKVYKVNCVCNCDVWLGTLCNRNQNTFSLKERWKNVTLKIIYIDVFSVLQSGLFLFKTEVTAVNWLSSFPIYLWEMVKPFLWPAREISSSVDKCLEWWNDDEIISYMTSSLYNRPCRHISGIYESNEAWPEDMVTGNWHYFLISHLLTITIMIFLYVIRGAQNFFL